LARGPIARLAASYTPSQEELLGFVLDMAYEEATLVTCDAWKRKCGGVPSNSFVLIRQNPRVATLASGDRPRSSLILARVTESTATPVSKEIQQTIFEIHKIQAVVDPYTSADLQWGALKSNILGTYFDEEQPNGSAKIGFGNDIDAYVSPHFYEVYVPRPADLELLINSFVSAANPIEIGTLRYTETRTMPARQPVRIRVAPSDFLHNRTALFGKTRSGKSNSIKQIADMMLRSGVNVGQVIFDLAGEYAYPNDQDKTSIYSQHRDRCVRYSLNPDVVPVEVGEPVPRPLKVNFFEQVTLGHSIIAALWEVVNEGSDPKYYRPVLDAWEPCDPDKLDDRFSGDENRAEKTRYLRAQAMYFAALHKATFANPRGKVRLCLHRPLRARLAAELPGVPLEGASDAGAGTTSMFESPPPARSSGATSSQARPDAAVSSVAPRPPAIDDFQTLDAAVRVYEHLHDLWSVASKDDKLFPIGETGKKYFEEVHEAWLRILGDKNVAGTKYLMPFAQYHALGGSHLTDDISGLVDQGKTVIIDLSNADEEVARYYSNLVTGAIFQRQITKFTRRLFSEGQPYHDHSVLFYFEEAHNLFERDDKNLRSVYNRLAKEGAKFRIGLVYGTQSMTTLSPDLMKNTENFFIAHLNDDREIHELVRHYEFRDVGRDVQRAKTQGYVRMITLSHRYALPVQIDKFGPR